MKFYISLIILLASTVSSYACSLGPDYVNPFKENANNYILSFVGTVTRYEHSANGLGDYCVYTDYIIEEHLHGEKRTSISTDFCMDEKYISPEALENTELNEMFGFFKGAKVLVALIDRDAFKEGHKPIGKSKYTIFTPTCYPMHANRAKLTAKEFEELKTSLIDGFSNEQ